MLSLLVSKLDVPTLLHVLGAIIPVHIILRYEEAVTVAGVNQENILMLTANIFADLLVV